MIYAINRRTREHRIISGALKCIAEWDGWDVVEADADGWIPWPGGEECPLPYNSVFDVRFRGLPPMPVQVSGGSPCRLRWTHDGDGDGDGGDIVAYRPILAAQPEPFVSVDMASQRDRTVGCRAARVAVTAPEWDGEGLPPEGIECEFEKTPRRFEWCQIKAHRGSGTWITTTIDDRVVRNDLVKFRPIRSDEDRAVEAMTRLVAGTGCGDNGNTRAGMRALYREGYRKTEVPNEDA